MNRLHWLVILGGSILVGCPAPDPIECSVCDIDLGVGRIDPATVQVDLVMPFSGLGLVQVQVDAGAGFVDVPGGSFLVPDDMLHTHDIPGENMPQGVIAAQIRFAPIAGVTTHPLDLVGGP